MLTISAEPFQSVRASPAFWGGGGGRHDSLTYREISNEEVPFAWAPEATLL